MGIAYSQKKQKIKKKIKIIVIKLQKINYTNWCTMGKTRQHANGLMLYNGNDNMAIPSSHEDDKGNVVND